MEEQALKEIGLNEREVQVYLALLKEKSKHSASRPAAIDFHTKKVKKEQLEHYKTAKTQKAPAHTTGLTTIFKRWSSNV